MTSLFNNLFNESFETLTTKDIDNGMISGIVSPYLGKPEDEIGLTLDDVENKKRFISNKLSKLHAKYSLNMKLDSANDLSGFTMFCSRLVRAFQLNKVFDDDPVIQKKLAELLTYFYISLSKSQSTYLIYSDLNQAKKVARMVYNKAEKFGLDFLPTSFADMLRVILFSVFFKLPSEKQGAGPGNVEEPPTPGMPA